MSTDTDETDERRMQKIDVRVPASLLDAVDEEYAKRGYASRSEAIRDAIRDWVAPPVQFSEDVLDDLERSRAQRERGETVSTSEARERLGLDDRVDE